jgi:DNA-binding transcriptional regulator YiaG
MSTVLDSRVNARPASAQSLLLAVGFGALVVVGSSNGQLSPWALQSSISSSNVAPSEVAADFVLGPIVRTEERQPVTQSTAQLLAEARMASGLTWDQIARYFGVSRRAVHLWASGGRMTASNEELLTQLVRAVDAVKPMGAGDRRQALLRADSGLNIVDTERARRSSRKTDINRSPEIGVEDDQA